MKLKVGDKVKFLNELGGGIISKIIDHSIVHVAIEDGFEIPTLVKDLVLVSSKPDHAEKMFAEDFDVNLQNTVKQTTPSIIETGLYPPGSFPAGKELGKGVYIAFIPQNQNILVSGEIDIVLLNHTSTGIVFQLYRKEEGGLKAHSYGMLKPSTRKTVDTIPREELDNWTSGTVQLMYQMPLTDTAPLPESYNFSLKASRFFNENSYILTNLAGEKLIPLTIKSGAGFSKTKQNPKYDEIVPVRKVTFNNETEIINGFVKKDGSAVIDLHIHNITEDHMHLKPTEALKFQLSYFSKLFESAVRRKVTKMIIIHGVGNGILKNEIIKQLDEYDFIHYFDAPIALYGVGATEVKLFYGKL